MANKVALLVLGVIVMTSMGVGALVGVQFGPGGPTEAGEATASPTTTAQPTDDATPSGNNNGENNGGKTTATSTGTTTPQPTVAPEEFDREEIEAEVLADVNAYRKEQGLAELDGRPEIVEMARFHSENMAEQGYISHAAGGFNTQDRYERFDLADRCKVANNAEQGILSGEALETLQRTVAGRPYEQNGETRYNANESAVARAVVQNWIDREDSREKLNLENADQVGIGVIVTDDGVVYVTLDLC